MLKTTTLFVSVQPTSFVYRSENGRSWIEDLTKKSNYTASPSDVVLFYYSQKHPEQVQFKSTNDSPIAHTDFNPNKTTVFIIHGWLNSHLSQACQRVKDFMLRSHDVNVFTVDWNSITRFDYVIAQANVVQVGQYLANFIKLLVKNHGLDLKKVKLVGHSLGAHVLGNCGAALGGKVGTIMGFDPAGPLFTLVNIHNRLDSTDAINVQVNITPKTSLPK